MSSDASFESAAPCQVSVGVGKSPLRIKKKKSKCSKSSGSASKSAYCSSCDDEADQSERDTEKRRTSTSEASSTNVLYFKNITDSSANSVERVPLRPGKRRSVCSKLGVEQKKIKVFKGIEGMEDSLENFCEFHKQLRLKNPEKPFTKKRHTSPDFMKYQRHSFQKEERLVRIKKPSTAGVVNDIPETKYPESIFSVFMKPQQKIVKKRIVEAGSENYNQRALKAGSKTLFEATPLEKKRSPIAFMKLMEKPNGKPKEKFVSQARERKATICDTEEVGDCKAQTDCSAVEGNVEKVEVQPARKSKSTLKSNGSVKPTSSKRSVHWEDEVIDAKRNKNSSEEAEDTHTTEPMESKAARSNQIRTAYEKIKHSITDSRKTIEKHPPKEMSRQDSTQKEDDFFKNHSEKFGRASSQKNSTTVHFETKCQEVVVAHYQEKSRCKIPLLTRFRMKDKGCHDEEKKILNPKLNLVCRHSSSESDILSRRRSKHYSESSDDADFDEFSNDGKSLIMRRKCTPSRIHSDTDASYSSLEEDYKSFDTASRKSRRRTNMTSEDNLRIPRRTSSPAILKAKDSIHMLVRGKSSPIMDRKIRQQQSNSTLSSTSFISESSVKISNDSYGRGERSHTESLRCHYEQANLQGNSEALSNTQKQLCASSTKENTCQTKREEIKNKKMYHKYSYSMEPKKSESEGQQNALLCFKKCLKQTEKCLEKLNPLLAPEPRDTKLMIKKIRAKLSKIRHEVDDVHSGSGHSKGHQKVEPSINTGPAHNDNNKPDPVQKFSNKRNERPGLAKKCPDEKNAKIVPIGNKTSSSSIPAVHNRSSLQNQLVAKPHSADSRKKRVPQTERSKQILQAWDSTEKAIGERSERLLQTMRSLREKKLSLSLGSECSSDIRKDDLSNEKISSSVLRKKNDSNSSNNMKELESYSNSNKVQKKQNSSDESMEIKNSSHVDRSISQHKINDANNNCSAQNSIIPHYNKNPKCNENIHQKNEECDEPKLNRDDNNVNHGNISNSQCLNVPSNSINKIDFMARVTVVDEELDSDYEIMQERTKEYNDSCLPNESKGSIKIETNEPAGSNQIDNEPDATHNVLNNNDHVISDEKLCNNLTSLNVSKSDSNVEMCNNVNDQGDSDFSCVSLENVTTASLDTEPTDRHMASTCLTAPSPTSSAKSSRPPSRYRDQSPNDRRSGSSKRAQLERPPSRKPYLERDTSDEGDSDGPNLSHVRVYSHQPRSRNSPASLRMNLDQRKEESNEPKKPPSSRMYSTLKETPFSKKEYIKSAIEDLNLSPKQSFKNDIYSSPPTAKSSAHDSDRKHGNSSKPSTPKPEWNTTNRSMMSPGSLRILKEKAKKNRELNAQKSADSSNNTAGPSRSLNRGLNQRSDSIGRVTSGQKTTPEKSGLRSTLNRSSRPSTACAMSSSISGTWRDSKVRNSPRRKSDLKVTFQDDNRNHLQQPLKKVVSFHRVPLSKRLPNYKPPWERVDLRPPESALAERALHEKRLFGGRKKSVTRSQASSDASRPQTPMTKSTELRNPSKASVNPASGTATNTSLTVNSSNVPRHDYDSDCSRGDSLLNNSSSYDTAVSSVLLVNTKNTRECYSHVAKGSSFNLLKYSSSPDCSRTYGINMLRKTSSINTNLSYGGKTYKTSSVQTVIENRNTNDSKKKSVKVNVSVRTKNSASNLQYTLN